MRARAPCRWSAVFLTRQCLRDAEEYGLVGSTWYGETFAKDLDKKAVAYLNVDVGNGPPSTTPSASPQLTGSLALALSLSSTHTTHGWRYKTAVAGGDFQAGATPSLRSLLRDVTRVVNYPDTNSSIASTWDGYISTLGSGSGACVPPRAHVC